MAKSTISISIDDLKGYDVDNDKNYPVELKGAPEEHEGDLYVEADFDTVVESIGTAIEDGTVNTSHVKSLISTLCENEYIRDMIISHAMKQAVDLTEGPEKMLFKAASAMWKSLC